MIGEIEALLERLRPALALEGIGLELAGVEEGVARVRVRIPGPEAHAVTMGLLAGIQRTLQAEIPCLRAVVSQDLLDAGYSMEQLAAQMQRSRRPTTDDRRLTTDERRRVTDV